MASNYNWSFIQSGESFQSLINTLLQFKCPGTKVFGRPGKDSAQDARSADGKTVYQYKHHTSPTISKTLDDASKELTKINKYKQPTDPRYKHWENAADWVLVTNLSVNANDKTLWENKVVVDFAKIGLKAALWDKEKIEALLAEYPHVAEAYFEGQNRCFLSVGEAFEFTRADEIGAAGLKVALSGRDAELARVDAFIKGTKKVMWMHGPGGIGKSRLLLEVGAKAEVQGTQVLWAAEATISQSTQWFTAINYNLPTLLLIDEPQDPLLLRRVAEQIKIPNSQIREWKVIIALRSPNDPVLKAIADLAQNLRDDPMVLSPLNEDQAMQLALDLLDESTLSSIPQQKKSQIAVHLSKLGDRFPIWIAIAVNVLAKHGNLDNLPNDSNDIAKKYVDEVIERSMSRNCTQKQLEDLIRWVAIYEEIDIEESLLVSFVAKQSWFEDETRLLDALNSLVTRRLLVRRGVRNRLYSIKPDVVRDYIVRSWLTWTVGDNVEATPAANSIASLILNGFQEKPLPAVQLLIKSLAKTELAASSQGVRVELLAPLVAELKRIAQEGNVSNQHGILGYIGSIDFARLRDILDIFHTIRRTEKPPQEHADFFGRKHEITHKTVVSELPWLLFNAARYARTPEERVAVIEEMMELALFEARDTNVHSNDGKRASSLIPRMISGENGWYSGFKGVALEKAMTLLSKLREPGDIDEASLGLIRVLCEPVLSVEQRRDSFERHNFTSTRRHIRLTSHDGENRRKLRAEIRETLEMDAVPLNSRLLCWKLLAVAHASANRAISGRGNGEIPQDYVAEIKDDLKSGLSWAMRVLNAKAMDIGELRSARELWEWHYRFEEDSEIKSLAVDCESCYQRNPLVATFHVLFSFELYEEAAKKASELGAQFGATGTRESIALFLRQAQEFAPEGADSSNIFSVGDRAAVEWQTNRELKSFTRDVFASKTEGFEFAFAVSMLNRRLRTLRESNRAEDLKSELQDAVQSPAIAEAKVTLMLRLYSRPHPLLTGILTSADLEFVLSALENASCVVKPSDQCRILAGMYHVNWSKVSGLCNAAIDSTSEEDKANCFVTVFETFHFLDLFRRELPSLGMQKKHFDWLLDKLVMLPDVDHIGEYRQHEFGQLVQRFGQRDLDWLLAVIKARIHISNGKSEEGEETFKMVPTRHRLTIYVSRVDSTRDPSPSEIERMGVLLEYAERKDTLGFVAPQYAEDLDPNGVVIPGLVASKIESLNPKRKDTIWNWSRFAGSYGFNSPAWRQIAKAALRACAGFSPRDRDSIFVQLLPQGIKSSEYAVGEIDPRPERDLNIRKREMQEEKDEDLVVLRQWHLHMAQAEFDHALARYKEESEE